MITLSALLLCASCDNTPPSVNEVMTIGWTRVDFGNLHDPIRGEPMWADVVAIAWNGTVREERWAEAEAYFVANSHLVSLATGELVPGEMRPGFHRVSGESIGEGPFPGAFMGASFIADNTLDSGWYVAVIDLRDWLASHRELFPFPEDTTHLGPYLEEGFLYARFQVGDAPTWVRTAVNDGDFSDGAWCYVLPMLAPPTRTVTNPFELRVDGVARTDCSAAPNEDGWWMWRCPFLPDETILTIDLVPGEVAGMGAVSSQEIAVAGLPLGGGSMPTAAAPGRSGYVPVDLRAGIDLARGAL
jgi:hypothetical protein